MIKETNQQEDMIIANYKHPLPGHKAIYNKYYYV